DATSLTGVGWNVSASVPMPSCPLAFAPQQSAAWSGVSAQVLLPPAASCEKTTPSPRGTRRGVVDACTFAGSAPSCPFELLPQHQTSPPAVSAQVCASPAAS